MHPISLGFAEARHLRGRPRLAEGEEASAILARFAALCRPFGTEVRVDGATATLHASEDTPGDTP